MAKSAYKWLDVFEGTHWESYCTSHDLPHIIHLKGKTKKDKKYKVDAGKDSRIEDTWKAATEYAIEIGKKRAKAVRKFEKQEAK